MKIPATNLPSNFFSWNGEYTGKYLQPGIERGYLSHGGEACVAVLAPLRLPDAEVLLRCRGCAENHDLVGSSSTDKKKYYGEDNVNASYKAQN